MNVELKPHNVFQIVERANTDGIAHYFTQTPDEDTKGRAVRLLWEPSADTEGSLVVTLRADGTWYAELEQFGFFKED